MPLIDLKTDLKSLKYGADRPGGGNSGQPYIKVDINKVDSGFNRFRMTKFDDGLVRGGTVGAINASVVDTLRVGKFLKDFPKGPLFIAKQVGLQLSNPQLEHKTNFPTNKPTKGQGLIRNIGNFISNVANKILNAVGPTRIYNLGINTLAQVPVNAFGQHIQRHGFTPRRNNDNLYFKVAQYNNNEGNNRLTQLRSILGNTNNINTYISGPSSVYGIGATIIRRRGDFIDINRDTTESEWAVKGAIEAGKSFRLIGHEGGTKDGYTDASRRITNFTGISDLTGSLLALSSTFFGDGKSIQSVSAGRRNYTPLGLDNKIASASDTKDVKYQAINQEASASQNIRNFTSLSNFSGSVLSTTRFPQLKEGTNIPSTLLNYTASNADTTTENTIGKWGGALTASKDLGLSLLSGSNIPSNINLDQNVVPYTSPKLKKYAELRNRVTETSTYKNYNSSKDTSKTTIPVNVSRGATDFKYVSASLANKFKRENDTDVNQDTLALVFTPLDPFTGTSLSTLKFLGYLAEFNESYDSTWNDVKYVGRAEKFYIFNEFKRTTSVSFNIPCYNETELLAKHCALSELASTLAGKYENNLLGGIITRLKLGRYIDNQPGIITNLSFNPIQDSSWDLDYELAFYLKVTFNFTLIHDFLPQYTPCGFIFNPPVVTPPKKEEKPQQPPVNPPTGSSGGGGGAPTTGSIKLPNINFTLEKARQDNTRNVIPIKNINRKFKGFGGGSGGGAGAGGSW